MFNVRQVKSVALRATLGAFFGALVQAAYLVTLPIWRLTMDVVALELPLWLAAMTLTYLPITIFAAVCARSALGDFRGHP